MEPLPQPRLSLDKLAVTVDIPQVNRLPFMEALFGCGQVGALSEVQRQWEAEVYYPSPLMGYNRSAVLERDGETCRIDFDPYRQKSRTLKPWEAFAIRKLADPFAYPDAELDLDQKVTEEINFARVELNPSKFPGADDLLCRICVDFVLSGSKRRRNSWEALHASMKPTRLDVAADYPVNIQDIGLYGVKKRITNGWYNGGNPETMYLGKSGGNQIAIYDKLAEQAKKRSTGFTEAQLALATAEWSQRPVTRVEARVRDLKTSDKTSVETISQLKKLINPFENLEVMKTKFLPDDADWKDKAVACMVEVYGIQATLKSMPERTARRYRKMFQEQGLPIIHPKDVFNAQFEEAGRRSLPSFFAGK